MKLTIVILTLAGFCASLGACFAPPSPPSVDWSRSETTTRRSPLFSEPHDYDLGSYTIPGENRRVPLPLENVAESTRKIEAAEKAVEKAQKTAEKAGAAVDVAKKTVEEKGTVAVSMEGDVSAKARNPGGFFGWVPWVRAARNRAVADLDRAVADLDRANAGLFQAKFDLGEVNAGLVQAKVDFGQAKFDLTQAKSELVVNVFVIEAESDPGRGYSIELANRNLRTFNRNTFAALLNEYKAIIRLDTNRGTNLAVGKITSLDEMQNEETYVLFKVKDVLETQVRELESFQKIEAKITENTTTRGLEKKLHNCWGEQASLIFCGRKFEQDDLAEVEFDGLLFYKEKKVIVIIECKRKALEEHVGEILTKIDKLRRSKDPEVVKLRENCEQILPILAFRHVDVKERGKLLNHANEKEILLLGEDGSNFSLMSLDADSGHEKLDSCVPSACDSFLAAVDSHLRDL